jgi:hypothetical protein
MSVFHHCDKIADTDNLKGGKVYFHCGSEVLVFWPHCYGSMVRQNIMVAGGVWWSKAAMVARNKRETERKETG